MGKVRGAGVTLTINRAEKPQFTVANAKATPSDEQVRCRGLTTSMLIKNPKCQPSVSISLAVRSSNSNSQHSEQRRGGEVGDKGSDRGRKLCDGHIKLSTQLLGRVSAALGMKTLNPTVVGRVVTHSFSSPPT